MKLVGYCPDCHNPIAKREIGKECHRCGRVNLLSDLVITAPKPVTRQNGYDLLKRHYKTSVMGIRTGAIPIKRSIYGT